MDMREQSYLDLKSLKVYLSLRIYFDFRFE